MAILAQLRDQQSQGLQVDQRLLRRRATGRPDGLDPEAHCGQNDYGNHRIERLVHRLHLTLLRFDDIRAAVALCVMTFSIRPLPTHRTVRLRALTTRASSCSGAVGTTVTTVFAPPDVRDVSRVSRFMALRCHRVAMQG